MAKRTPTRVIYVCNVFQAVLQGVAFTGVQVLRQKRLILLHEERVYLPESPIRNSEEFEVGNGKNSLHPPKSPIFVSRSVKILVRMVISVCNDLEGRGVEARGPRKFLLGEPVAKRLNTSPLHEAVLVDSDTKAIAKENCEHNGDHACEPEM